MTVCQGDQLVVGTKSTPSGRQWDNRIIYGLEMTTSKGHGQTVHPDQQQMGAKQEQFASTHGQPLSSHESIVSHPSRLRDLFPE